MTSSNFLRTTVAVLAIAGAACSSSTPITSNSTGGSAGGGKSGEGGTTGSGGVVGTGGTTSSGGQTATGGATSSGGQTATGGATSSGGQPGSGGRNTPPDASAPDVATSSGGRSGSGGRSAPDDASGTGGSGPGTGGTTGPGTGGSTAIYVGTKTPGTAPSGAITVDPTKTHQVVDGFGLADVWQGSSSTAMQTLLWDPVNGIGLNLLRIGIESASGKSVLMGNAAIADGQACKKFSGDACKVWAAPWSPPASMKGNNNVNGNSTNACSASSTSRLNTSSYDAWTTMLAGFPATYKAQSGIDLYALSAQNEPDWNPNYEACCFTGAEMVNFVNVLGPKLAALSPPVKLLAAEPDNWSNFWSGDNYATDILADAKASANVAILATHDYGSTSAGTYGRPAPPASNTHHIWETECTPNPTDALTIATMVYAAFSTGGVNGWHYWWTQSFVPNASSPPDQYYALGNFSKFVHAGYYRVDVSGAAKASGTVPLVVAFSNLSDGTVSIVVVNGGSAQQVSLFVAGTAWPASVTPYVTSASSKLAAGTAITVTAGAFTASLDAKSVTTFVGKP